MKLTIIPSDKTIYVNDKSIFNLNFNCPDNIHALQWQENKGHIEFLNVDDVKPNNEILIELPNWAIDALAAYEQEKNRLNAEAEIALQATKSNSDTNEL